MATIDMTVGQQHFQWDAYVAPIGDKGILSYDFLYFYDCVLARNGIRIADNWFKWTIKGTI